MGSNQLKFGSDSGAREAYKEKFDHLSSHNGMQEPAITKISFIWDEKIKCIA